MDPAKMPGGASRLMPIAIAVVFLAALCGCAGGSVGGVGVSGGGGGGDGGGGGPSTGLGTPTAAEVEDTLNRLSQEAGLPELSSFGGAVATCEALGCPVHDAIHVDHRSTVHGPLDFSGFDFLERRHDVSLATKSHSSGRGNHFTNHRTLGGWMRHGFFLVEALHNVRYADFSYRTWYMGNTQPTNPAVSVSGTWSGAMAGVVTSSSEDDGAFVRGDATVTVSHPGGSGDALVDVAFASITREDTGARIGNLTWENLTLENGNFGVGNVLHNHGQGYFGMDGFRPSRGNSIFGQFYGPDHEEVGGLFHRDGLAGAFGANRND